MLTFTLLVEAFLLFHDKRLNQAKVITFASGPLLKSKDSEIFFWTLCSGVIVTYLVVGMYFSMSQIFFGMKLFVSIFVLPLFLLL